MILAEKTNIIFISIFVGLVIVICGLIIFFGAIKDKKQMKEAEAKAKQRSEERRARRQSHNR